MESLPFAGFHHINTKGATLPGHHSASEANPQPLPHSAEASTLDGPRDRNCIPSTPISTADLARSRHFLFCPPLLPKHATTTKRNLLHKTSLSSSSLSSQSSLSFTPHWAPPRTPSKRSPPGPYPSNEPLNGLGPLRRSAIICTCIQSQKCLLCRLPLRPTPADGVKPAFGIGASVPCPAT